MCILCRLKNAGINEEAYEEAHKFFVKVVNVLTAMSEADKRNNINALMTREENLAIVELLNEFEEDKEAPKVTIQTIEVDVDDIKPREGETMADAISRFIIEQGIFEKPDKGSLH